MEIRKRRQAGRAIVTIVGSIRIDVAKRLRNELKDACSAGVDRLEVDLSGVDFIDSSGLATLLECLKRLQKGGSTMTLIGLSEQVLEIFKIAQLDRVFDIGSSQDPDASAS